MWDGIEALKFHDNVYSHLSNSRGGWNKCGGWNFLEKTST